MVFAVPQAEARVDAVLLSDELVALPSSLSDAESAAAAAAAAAVTAEAAVAEPPAVAVVVTAAAGLGGVGTWPSLRLRISGVSDTVLIFNFPSSEASTEADEVTLFPLSEVLSASSPELTVLELEWKKYTF